MVHLSEPLVCKLKTSKWRRDFFHSRIMWLYVTTSINDTTSEFQLFIISPCNSPCYCYSYSRGRSVYQCRYIEWFTLYSTSCRAPQNLGPLSVHRPPTSGPQLYTTADVIKWSFLVLFGPAVRLQLQQWPPLISLRVSSDLILNQVTHHPWFCFIRSETRPVACVCFVFVLTMKRDSVWPHTRTHMLTLSLTHTHILTLYWTNMSIFDQETRSLFT